MKIYKKLADARVRLQEMGLKPSGFNKFAGYGYFELSDILPVVNRLGQELGFICTVSFTSEEARLTVKDLDGEGEAVFTSPMAGANLKGCHEVQNLGASQTYLKRYLYQHAFEIVEADALNATHNPSEQPAQKPAEKPRLSATLEADVIKMVLDAGELLTKEEQAIIRKSIEASRLLEEKKRVEKLNNLLDWASVIEDRKAGPEQPAIF